MSSAAHPEEAWTLGPPEEGIVTDEPEVASVAAGRHLRISSRAGGSSSPLRHAVPLMTACQIQSPLTPDRYARTHTRRLNRPNTRQRTLEAHFSQMHTPSGVNAVVATAGCPLVRDRPHRPHRPAGALGGRTQPFCWEGEASCVEMTTAASAYSAGFPFSPRCTVLVSRPRPMQVRSYVHARRGSASRSAFSIPSGHR
ncbi:hypothetical protein FALBO_60 [Fusarium albosuccineum]|uniref:Uncharacterized protein n=1 Tax=Fusarium albosuccineum TaxID=1237068 RepID=A0A8H4LQB9_9HYPO|nr:hypothetical protein FALBO_60 [Fusarium albosuccineum]